jgi:hypothetical protein
LSCAPGARPAADPLAVADAARAARWCNRIVSAVDSKSLPDMLVLHLQEVGGKHKENVPLLLRKGDILSETLHDVTQRIQQLYQDAGSAVWISQLIMKGFAPAGFALDPLSPTGTSPCDDDAALNDDKENTDETVPSDEVCEWADDTLLPQGRSAEFSALASIYIAKVNVLDARRLCLVDMDSQALLDPREALRAWGRDTLTEFLPHRNVCRHAKVHVSSRKGFLMTRWFVGQGCEKTASEGSKRGQCGWFNIINLHLIHDDHNGEASKAMPSPTAVLRGKMMALILHLLRVDGAVPTVAAGDFNFRLDLQDVIQKSEGRVRVLSKSEIQHDVVGEDSWNRLRPFDRELKRFNEAHPAHELLEVTEPASRWPCTFSLDVDTGGYNTKRFPAWTDRILGTRAFWSLAADDVPVCTGGGEGRWGEAAGSRCAGLTYSCVGMETIADHSAVYMCLNLCV